MITLILTSMLATSGCVDTAGRAIDPFDLAQESQAWRALLNREGPLVETDLPSATGRSAVHVWRDGARWNFFASLRDGAPAVLGSSNGFAPEGRWYFFGAKDLVEWALIAGDQITVVSSPCEGNRAQVVLVDKSIWQLQCVDKDAQNHGPYQQRSSLGVVLVSGVFARGVKVGEWRHSYDDGCRAASYRYRDGKLDGEATEWTSAGEVLRRGRYDAGRKVGVWEGAPCGAWQRVSYPIDADDAWNRCLP